MISGFRDCRFRDSCHTRIGFASTRSAITGTEVVFPFIQKHQKPEAGFKTREYEHEAYIPKFDRSGFDSHGSDFSVVV